MYFTTLTKKNLEKKLLTNLKKYCIILFVSLLLSKYALVAKSVDAQDLKSCGNLSRAGSSPARGTRNYAGVAQLVERQPSKLNVASSTLVSRSKNLYYNGDRSSVGRAPVCGTGCRGFDPRRSPHLRH